MALAMMQKDPSETRASATDLGKVVLPSFHRPALINYWANGQSIDFANPMNASLLRKVLLRPNWFDHPNFTGSNPEYALAEPTEKINRMIYGPWDVDNDNDGVRDGIWTDIGSPVMAGPDGRLVKPLVSFLVLDLDGRVNVNMHGTIEHIRNVDHPAAKSVAGGIMSSGLPRGQGYGPADISLAPVLEDRYDEILQGTIDVAGRYGDSFRYGDSLQIEPNGDTNRTDPSERYPGEKAIYDLVAQLKQQGLPTHTSELSNYASPPDFHGRYRFGINDIGQPVYEAIDDSFAFDTDTPYETNNSLGTSRGESASAADALYSLAELERLLRAYDVDAVTLPSRLWDLGNIISQPTKRNQITTDSVDLPVPNVVVPEWMLAAPDATYASVMGKPAVNASFADLLEYRIRAENRAISEVNLRQLMAMLMPQDLADGLRLDINRPLGNGRDDDNDGVVDEPGEYVDSNGDDKFDPGEDEIYWQLQQDNGNNIPLTDVTPRGKFVKSEIGSFRDEIDRNGDGSLEPWERGDKDRDDIIDDSELASLHVLRRQHLARDMYVLAMTLVNPYELGSVEGKAKTRQLAQWAINTVDFRDPDNCMTPFEYDENPFDGWGVDGDLLTDDSGLAERGVVWGSEQPELLITETIAWHDRRTTDEANEVPNTGQDAADKTDPVHEPNEELDQLYRPRGGFFLELYNPRPANPAANADTHETSTGNDLGVDISKTHDGTTTGSPVWRLLVYKIGGPDKDPDDLDPANRPTDVDRSVYFTGFDPGYPAEEDGAAFFNDPDNTLMPEIGPVRPGRYLVVGSGEDVNENGVYQAPLGDLNPLAATPAAGNRRFELDTRPNNAHRVRLIDHTNLPAMNAAGTHMMQAPDETLAISNGQVSSILGDTSRCISDVAVIDQAMDLITGTIRETRQLTLSEPATGYIPPAGIQYHPPGAGDIEGWYGPPDGSKKPIDTPLDDHLTRGDPDLQQLGTKENYRWIYLQRLANTLLPWNPETEKPGHDPTIAVNPYLSVDSTSSNITVFNGKNAGEKGILNRRQVVYENFASLERGRQNNPAKPRDDTSANTNPWNPENPGTRPDGRRMTNNHYFPANPDCSFGYLNAAFDSDGDQIVPDQPFPWLNWNNRPYVSANELLQVPSVRSSQLLKTFSLRTQDEIFKGAIPASSETTKSDGVFRHQANFFRHEEDNAKEAVAGLYRVLEYLHVPSRFVGTEMWLNPFSFGQAVTDVTDPRLNRQPPFNRISAYRDPGQMNLNTISDKGLDALFHRDSGSLNIHPGPDWVPFRDSRRGYGGSSTLDLEKAVPTFFENPFRSSEAGTLVPLLNMIRKSVECTVLRSDNVEGVTAGKDAPLFVSTSTAPHSNADRNSYFRYQPLTRIDNLTTTRSNVYAVWITVGFFEVEPAPGYDQGDLRWGVDRDLYNRVYPEGYQLGKEAGIETGDVVRVREFAIIDRSIPVAFEPGADHNVEQVIRLRRRIE